MDYIETSAKTGYNVKEAFELLVKSIISPVSGNGGVQAVAKPPIMQTQINQQFAAIVSRTYLIS